MPTLTEKTEIKINGKLYEDYNFLNIKLTQELLKPCELRFTMQKKNYFKEEDDVDFKLHKEIMGGEVSCLIQTLRYKTSLEMDSDELEFEGIIFEVNMLRREFVAGFDIEVVAYSPEYVLTDTMMCRSDLDKTLSEIVSKTIEGYDIKVLIDPQYTNIIPYHVQYNESHYDCLVRLAKRYGEWLYNDGKQMIFGNIILKFKDNPVLRSSDLLGYKYTTKIKNDAYNHTSYDYLKSEFLKKYNHTDYKEPYLDSVRRGSKITNTLFLKGYDFFKEYSYQYLETGIAEENEKDITEHSLNVKTTGNRNNQNVFSGTSIRADLQIGSFFSVIDLFDSSETRSENFYDEEVRVVTKIIHSVGVDGHYQNEFTAVLRSNAYPPYYDIDIHNVCGNQLAKVVDNNDPKKMGRIQVELHWQKKGVHTPWIRIAQPHGGDDKGFYFIPEIGEQVIVGYEMGNIEKPFVLGTLYEKKEMPGKKWPNANNNIKAIRTRNGHTVEIHDSGGGGYIRIYDHKKENYVLTFSTDEKVIRLQSTGNIELIAENDIVLKAGKNIIENAGNDISIKAENNRETEINVNDTIKVGKDRGEELGGNHSLKVVNFSVEATADVKLTSAKHSQSATGSMGITSGADMGISAKSMEISGGSALNVKATIVNIN